MTRVAVVVHEEKVATQGADDPLPLLAAAIQAAGWPPPSSFPTSAGDPGRGSAQRALDQGAELIVVCGGDGTVSSCSAAIAGSGVPMAVLPIGTGNLIAGNLGVPSDTAAAVEAVISGADRTVDVGRTPEGVVVGMAGVGLDAAMVADAPTRLKRRLGWSAYIVSLARHLADRGFDVVLELDGVHRSHRHVRSVVVGNVGGLHGGVTLFPGARPDDGLLDVVVLAPRSVLGWLAIAVRLAGRSQRAGTGRSQTLRRYQARRVVITSPRRVPREIDGEALPSGHVLDVTVEPQSLLIRVPKTSPDR